MGLFLDFLGLKKQQCSIFEVLRLVNQSTQFSYFKYNYIELGESLWHPSTGFPRPEVIRWKAEKG